MPEVHTVSHREVVQRLGSAQKARSAGAPAYSVLVNRPAGRQLAARAYRLGMTPDGVTATSAAFSLAAILAVALAPAWGWWGLLVWALLAAGYALDSADGQLARLRGGGSPAGEWLDHVVDAAKISSLHGAVLVWAFRHLDLPSGWLLVPLGFAVVAAVAFFTQILNDSLRRAHPGGPVAAGSPSLRRSLVVLPTDYGVLCLAFVLLGTPVAFFAVYTALAAASAAHLFLALPKWHRDMVALNVPEVLR